MSSARHAYGLLLTVIKETSEDTGSRVPIGGTGSFQVKVVGGSHCQKNQSSISGGLTEDEIELITTAALIHDDSNQYDSKAILALFH